MPWPTRGVVAAVTPLPALAGAAAPGGPASRPRTPGCWQEASGAGQFSARRAKGGAGSIFSAPSTIPAPCSLNRLPGERNLRSQTLLAMGNWGPSRMLQTSEERREPLLPSPSGRFSPCSKVDSVSDLRVPARGMGPLASLSECVCVSARACVICLRQRRRSPLPRPDGATGPAAPSHERQTAECPQLRAAGSSPTTAPAPNPLPSPAPRDVPG